YSGTGASLKIVTNDQGNSGAGGSLSDTSTVNITVSGVNDAPINTVPGGQTIGEDSSLVFSISAGNAISISDVDIGAGTTEVTLIATGGTLTLNSMAGLVFTAGDGIRDGVITVTGTMANINAALDGMLYSPAADFNGTGSVQISTSDFGNTGAGGSLSDADSF